MTNLKNEIPGYGVSRNQNTVIEGAVYGKALTHIYRAFDKDEGVFGSPSIYFKLNSEFDPNPLIETLETFAQKLDNTRINNYIELVKFYDELKKSIIAIANK